MRHSRTIRPRSSDTESARKQCAPPWSPTIDELCTDEVRGELYAHELVSLAPGAVEEYLDAVESAKIDAYAEYGLSLVGAFRTAMRVDDEAVLIWAIPSWGEWADFEAALLDPGRPVRWDEASSMFQAVMQRTLLVDAEFAPLRTGRQPQVEDRRPLDEA